MIVTTTHRSSSAYTACMASSRFMALGLLPHQVAAEEQRDGAAGRVRECLRLHDAAPHVLRRLEPRTRDAQRIEHVLRDAAPLRLPRVALAELAAVADEHEQRDAVELRARHDAVDRGEE